MSLALVARIKGYLSKPVIPSGDVSVSDTGVFTVAGMSLGAAVLKTIASGAFALTANKYHYKVAGEGGSADNLDSITGGAEGKVIVLRPSSGTVDITIRDTGGGTGNIRTPGQASIVLAELADYAILVNDGTNWTVVAFSTKAADIGTARLAASAVTAAKMALFVSTEQTGTGASQNVAHGLSGTPTKVLIAVTEDPAGTGFDVAEGAHDGTNVVVTVTTGVKFKVWAML